jgi:uncharacterized coiled-coil protein SlyX
MPTIEELEKRLEKLEETILVQGDIIQRVLEILKQRTDRGAE